MVCSKEEGVSHEVHVGGQARNYDNDGIGCSCFLLKSWNPGCLWHPGSPLDQSRKERHRWLVLLSYIHALVYHERNPSEQPVLQESGYRLNGLKCDRELAFSLQSGRCWGKPLTTT